MAHTKAMGLGAMLILLVAAVVILPMVVRFIDRSEPHYVISGFQNMAPAQGDGNSVRVPAGATSAAPAYQPDVNTNYLCRAPNGSSQPCPEGTFCDGLTQSCVPNYVGGNVPDVGYFS